MWIAVKFGFACSNFSISDGHRDDVSLSISILLKQNLQYTKWKVSFKFYLYVQIEFKADRCYP